MKTINTNLSVQQPLVVLDVAAGQAVLVPKISPQDLSKMEELVTATAASETAAGEYAQAAQGSATTASGHAQAASESATTASEQAQAASESATTASEQAQSARESASAAQESALNSQTEAEAAEESAKEARTEAQAAKVAAETSQSAIIESQAHASTAQAAAENAEQWTSDAKKASESSLASATTAEKAVTDAEEAKSESQQAAAVAAGSAVNAKASETAALAASQAAKAAAVTVNEAVAVAGGHASAAQASAQAAAKSLSDMAGLEFDGLSKSIYNPLNLNYTQQQLATAFTTSLNELIKKVSLSGGGTVSIPDGQFLVDVTVGITLLDNIELRFGKNTILKALAHNSPKHEILRIHDVNNVTISGGGMIDGSKSQNSATIGEWGMGVSIRGADNIHISDLKVKDTWGDGFYIGRTTNRAFSSRVTLDRVGSDGARRNGLSVISVKELDVNDSSFDNSFTVEPKCGIDLEPNLADEFIQGVRFKNLKTSGNNIGINVFLYPLIGTNALVTVDINGWTDRNSKRENFANRNYLPDSSGYISVDGFTAINDEQSNGSMLALYSIAKTGMAFRLKNIALASKITNIDNPYVRIGRFDTAASNEIMGNIEIDGISAKTLNDTLPSNAIILSALPATSRLEGVTIGNIDRLDAASPIRSAHRVSDVTIKSKNRNFYKSLPAGNTKVGINNLYPLYIRDSNAQSSAVIAADLPSGFEFEIRNAIEGSLDINVSLITLVSNELGGTGALRCSTVGGFIKFKSLGGGVVEYISSYGYTQDGATASTAQASATTASEQAQAAKASATTASGHALAAKGSADTASESASNAGEHAVAAGQQAQAAQGYATTAGEHAQAASESSTTAGQQAQAAQGSAATASEQAQSARESASAAQESTLKSQTEAEAAKAAAVTVNEAVAVVGGHASAAQASATNAQASAQAAAKSLSDMAGLVGGNDDLYAKMRLYTQSRLGLIANGSGGMGDNYNFSTMTYTQKDVYFGRGAFISDTLGGVHTTDEKIPLEPNSNYEFSVYARCLEKGDETSTANGYNLVRCFDADGLDILPQHVGMITVKLGAPLKNGDTTVTIHPDDRERMRVWVAANKNGGNVHLANPDYVNSKGYRYERGTYVRDIYNTGAGTTSTSLLYDVDNGVLSRFTINSAPAGGVASDESITLTKTGAVYVYAIGNMLNAAIPSDRWERYSGRFSTDTLRPGTAEIVVGCQLNRSSKAGTKTALSAMSLHKVF